RRRTLDVENHFRARVEPRRGNVAAGFDEHFVTVVTEPLDQFESFFLREWFAAGDFDEFAAEGADLVHDRIDRDVFAAAEGVLAVAPDTTHRATRQPHKRAGPAGVSRFSLNRAKYLGDAQHVNLWFSASNGCRG